MWGAVEERGGAAGFSALLPLPCGKTTVELSTPEAPPARLVVEKPRIDLPEEDLAKVRKAVEDRRPSASESAEGALRLMDALGGVAWQLSLRERHAAAVAAQQEGLAAVAGRTGERVEKARGMALDHLQRLAFYAGNAGVMLEALNERVAGLRREGKLDLAERQLREGLHRWIALGGGAGTASGLWDRIQAIAAERGNVGPIPEPHPAWGADR
jgi:hypothetical protein